MGRSCRATPLAVFLTVLICVVTSVFWTGGRADAAPIRPAVPAVPIRPAVPTLPAGPTAIVALGDSTAAGEGAGSYQAGTKGENGDWCHRSANAYVEHTGLAAVAINLACSGATSADVGFTTTSHYTEGSQAQRLIEVARAYRVTVLVAQLGANDDPAFGTTVVSCVIAYLAPRQPGCAASLAGQWPARLAAMEPKVVRALRDVRAAMARAGYQDQDYTLVLVSYSSPVTEHMGHDHGLLGCPYRDADAQWGRTEATPALSEALRGVAAQVNARFLDLSRATEGHEACSSVGTEWVRRLTVNPRVFAHAGFSAVGHLAQESFHPNATGDSRVAGCLARFVRLGAPSGRCVAGLDGQLDLSTDEPAVTNPTR